nr:hypothetical protein [Corynebacterium glutamicum]
MSKSDLKARPIYAHLNVVIAALVVSRVMETATGFTVKRMVRRLKKCRSFELLVEGKTIHVGTPLPAEVQGHVGAILKP